MDKAMEPAQLVPSGGAARDQASCAACILFLPTWSSGASLLDYVASYGLLLVESREGIIDVLIRAGVGM